MQDLIDTIKSLNLDPEKLQQIAQAAQDNPLTALSMVQELGISPETLQTMMMAMMQNPEKMLAVAKEWGVDLGS